MTEESYRFWCLIATWMTAFGTVGAVIVSLFLAGREQRVKLSVGAGHRIILNQGANPKPPEYCLIYVTNIGLRKARIVNIGWRIGFENPKFFIQTPPISTPSSEMPTELHDGEEARYLLPLSGGVGDSEWVDQFIPFLGRNKELDIRSMKVQIHTSIGKVFESKIEKGFADWLVKYVRER